MVDSSFDRDLKRTRVVLNPFELLMTRQLWLPEAEAVGIFMLLLPYVVKGRMTKDFPMLGRMAMVSTRKMRAIWPALATHFFDVSEDGTTFTLRESDWLTVQTVSMERQSLRRYLDRLVAFWGPACVYCGEESGTLEIEHIVPLARGGSDDFTNLTLACKPCNLQKRTQTAAEFGFPHIQEKAKQAH